MDPFKEFFKIIVVKKGERSNLKCSKCNREFPHNEIFSSFVDGNNLCNSCGQNMQLFLLKLFLDRDLR